MRKQYNHLPSATCTTEENKLQERAPPSDMYDLEAAATNNENATPNETERPPPLELPSVRQVFSFGSGPKKRIGLVLGLVCAVGSGCVFPAMAFIMATTFRTLSGPTSPGFMDDIRRIAFIFIGLGLFSLTSMTAQSAFLETAAGEMTYALKTSWFQALLRQDISYFDIQDVSGTATLISSSGAKYKAGVGRKLGEGVQFFVTFVGGFVYAFYASWQASLMLLALVPIMSASMLFFVKMNQSQTKCSNEQYAEAASIVYTAISAIRTVFSLNAVQEMMDRYSRATEKAYQAAAARMALLGLANGTVMGSMFGLRNVVVTLYGAYLLYKQVRSDGCDPSGNMDNLACDPDGAGIFGALIGITLGAAGLPQISVALEAFTKARAACQPALAVMSRQVGRNGDDQEKEGSHDKKEQTKDNGLNSISLPQYVIDSSSPIGLKPEAIRDDIEFHSVSLVYPSRKEVTVLDGFSLSVAAGQTVALVGPSGCGKSTVVSLMERFYDVTSGSITLGGIDLKEFNVSWLRSRIGLVSQEPHLFARSIRENIAYGCPGASQEQIEQAAKLANAHDFIMSFSDCYDTNVGDEGAQLSGGQKQRIAIARSILKRPSILLLDEATSSLDSESERAVQEALDLLLESSNMTTLVIAHRLSTIKKADLIAVVENGRVVEQGSHVELLAKNAKYKQLVDAQIAAPREKASTSCMSDDKENETLVGNGCVDALDVEPNSMDLDQSAQLVFRNVDFAYPTRNQNKIFKGFNLTVRRGETLAIVGPSGAGKSTVASLVERFYDAASGSITLDGVDLKEMNVAWLRDQLGLVQQEPTLFDTTIGENIRYGYPQATQTDIVEAARLANAHGFITSFPNGYNTFVGERGVQLSGGQKQRIAVARAIIKRPSILVLDEATSSLDSRSEKIVQEALDEIMKSKKQTAIVIAHRLSTLRNADRIAVIADGKVLEIGTHEGLLSKANGHFKRLSMFQSLDTESSDVPALIEQTVKDLEVKNDGKDQAKKTESGNEADEKSSSLHGSDAGMSDIQRARRLAKDDVWYFIIGSVGAILAGLCFPASGIFLAYTIELLYKPVPGCDIDGQPTCNSIATDMQDESLKIAYGWLGILGSTLIGNIILFHCFGTASERMNKRVRDAAFRSLLRQEVAFFDKHSIGSLSSQLQDDAAMIHSFTGEPIRTLVVGVSSLLVGLVISFVYMWPFALLCLAIIPFMAFAAKMKTKMFFGEDEDDESQDKKGSPGGILVETLLNMRAVASLCIEEMILKEYCEALRRADPCPIKSNFKNGILIGLGQSIQQWSMALMFFWGGWLLNNHPGSWEYRHFLISLFSLMISTSGLNFGAQGGTDSAEAQAAAKRIFYLIDRKSEIDPLSDAGWKGQSV